MSQSAREKSNPKHTPTSEQNKRTPPAPDVSPDDPFPIEPPGTSKPGQSQK